MVNPHGCGDLAEAIVEAPPVSHIAHSMAHGGRR